MPIDSSRFRAGDYVEVRSRGEILRTLDPDGRLDGLPFMPEMLRFCGRQFRVAARAHKTCDFVNKTGVRALPACVHLEGLRCDGSAHGGCQAQCTYFWKDAWLKFPGEPATANDAGPALCTEERLWSATTAAHSAGNNGDTVYVCQATRLPDFTRPLSPWNPRQYLEDYRSGNVASLSRFLPRAAYRGFDALVNLGIGLGRPLRASYDAFQKVLGRRRLYPGTPGRLPAGAKTPATDLNLQPGELVRVKDHARILETIDQHGMNRGMTFSAEMAPYCGGVFRVLGRVNRIIDEKTGRMIRMKTPCIVLQGVVCRAQFNRRMIFCPRATYSYWREIWLERVNPAPQPMAATAPPPVASNQAVRTSS